MATTPPEDVLPCPVLRQAAWPALSGGGQFARAGTTIAPWAADWEQVYPQTLGVAPGGLLGEPPPRYIIIAERFLLARERMVMLMLPRL